MDNKKVSKYPLFGSSVTRLGDFLKFSVTNFHAKK